MSTIKKNVNFVFMKTIIGIRVSETVKKSLQELADKEHRTLSNYVSKLLIEHLENIERQISRPEG